MKLTTMTLALCLATLGMLGACSNNSNDNDDALDRAANAAGRPLAITIAPKQGFIDADFGSGAGTRSIVDDATGNLTWETGDLIVARFNFDTNTSDSVAIYTYARTAAGTWETYEGKVVSKYEGSSSGHPIDDATKGTPVWPPNATKVKVNAVYADDTVNRGEVYSLSNFEVAMQCILTDVAAGTPIVLDMKRVCTRLAFTGLDANTQYKMECMTLDGFALEVSLQVLLLWVREESYTTDASGKVAFYPIIEINSTMDSNGTPLPPLVLKKASDGTVVFSNTFAGKAGKSYQCVLDRIGGGTAPDSNWPF